MILYTRSIALALATLTISSCGTGSGSRLQDDGDASASGDNISAILDNPSAKELLNFDIEETDALTDAIEIPNASVQSQSDFFPELYFGEKSKDYLRIYQDYLSNHPDFKELHSALLEYGMTGSQLIAAKLAYEQNAQTVTTNLPLGKGSEYWFQEAQKADDMYRKMRAQFAENGLDDILIIGFSKFSDDMFQKIRGGTGFDAVVAASEAASHQWNDGLVSLGAGPFELILGSGLLTSAGKALGRAAARTAAIRISAGYARTFVFNGVKNSVRAAVTGSRTLISQLIRSCTGLGLAGNRECANHVISNATSLFKHGWIKRSLFRELNGTAGPRNFEAFKLALKKGIVGPTGQAGIKHIEGPLFELKISGQAMRLLGLRNDEGIIVFTKFVREGLHKSSSQDLIESMLR
jgi:hypothetical protein